MGGEREGHSGLATIWDPEPLNTLYIVYGTPSAAKQPHYWFWLIVCAHVGPAVEHPPHTNLRCRSVGCGRVQCTAAVVLVCHLSGCVYIYPNAPQALRKSLLDVKRQEVPVPEAPTFYPTLEEMRDPMAYISRIAEVGKTAGIVRIVTPPGIERQSFAGGGIVYLG